MGRPRFFFSHSLAIPLSTTVFPLSLLLSPRLHLTSPSPLTLISHANGAVVLWDLETKKVIKSVTDAHKFPLVTLQFLGSGDEGRLLSLDISGVVRRLVVRRVPLVSYFMVDHNIAHSSPKEPHLAVQSLEVIASRLPSSSLLISSALPTCLVCTHTRTHRSSSFTLTSLLLSRPSLYLSH